MLLTRYFLTAALMLVAAVGAVSLPNHYSATLDLHAGWPSSPKPKFDSPVLLPGLSGVATEHYQGRKNVFPRLFPAGTPSGTTQQIDVSQMTKGEEMGDAAHKDKSPRVVVYHQTQYHNGNFISLLPLLYKNTGITHVIIAAIHLDKGGIIHLNDDPPSDPKYNDMWEEVAALQNESVKVLGMVGGGSLGTFSPNRLGSHDDSNFEIYYSPLKKMVTDFKLDGLDLDVEEVMSLKGVIRLIDRLKSDFGDDFLITLAPVASALQDGGNPSDFSYHSLEAHRGQKIAWYNAQLYNGWGNASNTKDYDAIMRSGLPPSKVVLGALTNKNNGAGYVKQDTLVTVLEELKNKYLDFGGVAGWEYFNASPDNKKPWLWVKFVGGVLKTG